MRRVLLCSGLDPSGGAGLLADARVAERFGVRPLGVATALTVQDSAGVRAVHPVPAEVLAAQLAAILSDAEVDAVKIGMLGTDETARVLASALSLTRAPVVWDPVQRASAGAAPLHAGDLATAADLLRDHLALVTPNLSEAGALAGFPVAALAEARRAAGAIRDRFGVDVLVTGGHLPVAPVDVFCGAAGIVELPGERIPGGTDVHGTGCALSTAIACELAGGIDPVDAARRAAAFVRDHLLAPVRIGRGRPSVI